MCARAGFPQDGGSAHECPGLRSFAPVLCQTEAGGSRLPAAEDAPAPSYELERIPHRDFVDLVMRYDQVPSAAPLLM